MDQSSVRVLVAAVVGAGVVIGTAGLFLYNEIYGEKRRMTMQQNQISRLTVRVEELRSELEDLQKKQREKMMNHAKRRTHKSRSDTESEYGSVMATDDEDDEFFDISDTDSIEPDPAGDKPDDPVLSRLLTTVDALSSGPADDKRYAYRELMDHLEVYESCVAVLWRLAKACSNMASVYAAEKDTDKQKQAIEQGLDYARRALALDEQSADAHKWFAILIGSRSEFMGTKEKIEDGNSFKHHLDLALAITPDDATLRHLLGRFKYEVASMSWLERKVASTLFAELPAATLSEAAEDCQEAERLSKQPWKQNRLLMAKCHIASSEYRQAVQWLDRAVEVKVVTPDDEVAHQEVLSLISKYGSYRS